MGKAGACLLAAHRRPHWRHRENRLWAGRIAEGGGSMLGYSGWGKVRRAVEDRGIVGGMMSGMVRDEGKG